MFVQAEVEIRLPFPVAWERLGKVIRQGQLGAVCQRASADGPVLLTRVGPTRSPGGLDKQVRVQLLTPYPRDGGFVLPLRWVATGPAGRMFPTLDADLYLAAAAPYASRLSLTGVYRPPFGALGDELNRAALARLAERTVRIFLDRLAEILAPAGAEPASLAACPTARQRAAPVA